MTGEGKKATKILNGDRFTQFHEGSPMRMMASGTMLAVVATALALPDDRTVRAFVDEDGNIVSGGGFSFVQQGADGIVIQFDEPFGDIPAIQITAAKASTGEPVMLSQIYEITPGSLRVVFGDNPVGGGQRWSLIAVGAANSDPHSNDDQRIVSGTWNGFGSPTPGFSVELNGNNGFSVIFDESFAAPPAFTVTPFINGDQERRLIFGLTFLSESRADVVFDGNNFAQGFSFIAIGPTDDTATPCDADFDGSGMVDLNDLAILLAAFGSACP